MIGYYKRDGEYNPFSEKKSSTTHVTVIRCSGPHLISAGRPPRYVEVFRIKTRHLPIGSAGRDVVRPCRP